MPRQKRRHPLPSLPQEHEIVERLTALRNESNIPFLEARAMAFREFGIRAEDLSDYSSRIGQLCSWRGRGKKRRKGRNVKQITLLERTSELHHFMERPYVQAGAEAHALFIENSLPPRDRE